MGKRKIPDSILQEIDDITNRAILSSSYGAAEQSIRRLNSIGLSLSDYGVALYVRTSPFRRLVTSTTEASKRENINSNHWREQASQNLIVVTNHLKAHNLECDEQTGIESNS